MCECACVCVCVCVCVYVCVCVCVCVSVSNSGNPLVTLSSLDLQECTVETYRRDSKNLPL